MPRNHTLEDTRDLLAAGLTPPCRSRHTAVGFYLGAGVLAWAGAIVGVVMTVTGRSPGIVAASLLVIACTVSIVACILAVTVTHWRAMTAEHRAIQTDIKQLSVDIGALAVGMEGLTQQVKNIDPWVIYSKIAGDLLGIKVDPGPLT